MLGMAYLNLKESTELVALRVPGDGMPRVVASPPQYYDERWSVTVSGLNNPVPFAFRLRIEIAPDASRFLFATADQWSLDATYDLTILRPNGDTIFSRSYGYDAEPIPDSAMDRGIATMVPENELARRFRATARQRAPAVYGPEGRHARSRRDGLGGTALHRTRHARGRDQRGGRPDRLSAAAAAVEDPTGQLDACVGDRKRPARSRERGSVPGDSAGLSRRAVAWPNLG